MKKKDNTLTKVEFQVMSILWDINHSACAWDIIERWDHSRTARCARESDSYCCLHIAIFLNSSDTGYNLLVLDTKGRPLAAEGVADYEKLEERQSGLP